MANLPIRYTSTFKSVVEGVTGSNEYTIQILDSDLGGDLNKDLYTTGAGFNLKVEGDDHEFQDIVKATSVTIPMFIRDAGDLGFLDLVINNQEQRFFVEILKNGSLFWRGVIYQDEILEEIAPIPFIFELKASDCLTELKQVFEKGAFNGYEFASVTERIIFALTKLKVNDLFTDSEKFLTTCFRWFEGTMPSALVDPGAYTNYNDKNYSYFINDEGEEDIIDQFELLRRILFYWNARIMMVNGSWLVVQVNEYEKTTINTFEYSRDYRTIGQAPPDRPGVIASNVPLEVQKKLESNVGFDFIKESDAVYQYLAALKSVNIDYDYELRTQLFNRVNGDFTTLLNTNQVAATGTGIGLQVFGQNRVKIEDTQSTSGIYNIQITVDAVIKIGSNWWNGSAWQGTAATVSIVYNDKLEPPVGAQLYYVPFSISMPTIPIQDNLELQFNTSVIAVTGVNTNPLIIEETTDVTTEYTDATGNGLKNTGFKVTNNLMPVSSVVLDLGDSYLGDYSSTSLKNGVYVIYPNQSANTWQKEFTGDQVAVNLLLCRELMFNRKLPRKKFEFSMRGAFSPHYSLLFNSKTFIINGGEWSARTEQFNGTYLELTYNEGDISTEISNDNSNDDQNATFGIIQGLNSDVRDRTRWRETYEEGATYLQNDQVKDGNSIFIANKQTTETPSAESVDWDILILSTNIDENPFSYYIEDNQVNAKIKSDLFSINPQTSMFIFDSNYNLVENPLINEDAFFVRVGDDIILKDL